MPETFEVSDALLEKFLAQHVEVDPKPLFAEGTIVGEWTLTGFLGRGGSAEVYCARQQSNGQTVAIKCCIELSQNSLNDLRGKLIF